MRYLTPEGKRDALMSGDQNRLKANGGLAADAKIWRGKRRENLTHG